MNHLVQVGLFGSVGRFRAADGRPRQDGTEVICRTERGLECGRVLRVLPDDDCTAEDGVLLRKVTRDDRLILERINRFRDRAFVACEQRVRQSGLSAVLVDVEHLFDGQSVYFYFLGNVTPELTAMTEHLAETWEAKVKIRQFAERLAEGCGPDCGTGDGCSSGGCGSCALKGSCRTS